jgi:hypothetical protein
VKKLDGGVISVYGFPKGDGEDERGSNKRFIPR